MNRILFIIVIGIVLSGIGIAFATLELSPKCVKFLELAIKANEVYHWNDAYEAFLTLAEKYC